MQQQRLQEAIEAVERILLEMGTDPAYGLPEPLFLFATTLMPVVNVDLLVADEQRRLLLTWRDDVHYGKGWHIPGGCVQLVNRWQCVSCKPPQLNSAPMCSLTTNR